MHIDTYYKQFWAEAIAHFKNGEFEYDPKIDDPKDKRFGLTVLVRPSDEVKSSISTLLDHFRRIEPDQYYYPPHDMHVTVLSVISCYEGFTRRSYKAADYVKIVEESIKGISPFKLHFQGITASPSCIMVQGYPEGMLNLFRKNLREAFNNSSLELSFDTRYTLMLAHATVMRFRKKISKTERFLEALEKYRNHEFGTTHINQVEFVFNDWYQRVQKGIVHAVLELES